MSSVPSPYDCSLFPPHRTAHGIHRALSTLTTLKDRAKKWAFKNTYLVYTSYLSYMKRYLFHSASSKRTITQCVFGAIFGSEFFSFSTCPLQFPVAWATPFPSWHSLFCTAPSVSTILIIVINLLFNLSHLLKSPDFGGRLLPQGKAF